MNPARPRHCDWGRKSRGWPLFRLECWNGKAAASRLIQKSGYLETRLIAYLRGKAKVGHVLACWARSSEDGLFYWVMRVMASQLLLVRHAEIAPQYAGRYVGSTDVPAEPHGLQQVRRLARLVGSRKPGRCFCSPLLRARETAEVICESTGLRAEIDNDLREVDFGQWEGKTFDEIAAEDPETVDRWAAFSDDFAFPGGESIGGFLTRICRAAQRLAEDTTDVVLAVTHAGVIRGMICHFLGLHSRHYLLFDVRHATCTTIDLVGGKGVLRGLNEQCVPERM